MFSLFIMFQEIQIVRDLKDLKDLKDFEVKSKEKIKTELKIDLTLYPLLFRKFKNVSVKDACLDI